MANILEAFQVLKWKISVRVKVDNLVFQLHYRFTVCLFLAATVLTTLYDYVGKKIECLIDNPGKDDPFLNVVNSYCYITGTYTVDKLHYGTVGVDMPHPGVGSHDKGDALTYHTYYQWVPFVLVAQGSLFYLPHLIWKTCEGGIFREVIQHLSIRDQLVDVDQNGMSKQTQFAALAAYIKETKANHAHKYWATKFVLCEALNVLVTIMTILVTNAFLGGEFFTYGLQVFAMSDMDPENRTDPMAQVFPRMGKCNFRMFGPSGGIEKRDVMCLLPTNIANEKIYIVLWFWLVILAIIGTLWLMMRLATTLQPVRNILFMWRSYNMPHINYDEDYPDRRILASKDQIRKVLWKTDFSDYLLLTELGENMDTALFGEFVAYLATNMNDEVSQASFSDIGMDSGQFELASLKNGVEIEKMSKEEEAMCDEIYPHLSTGSNETDQPSTGRVYC